jgi:hypothetical protein
MTAIYIDPKAAEYAAELGETLPEGIEVREWVEICQDRAAYWVYRDKYRQTSRWVHVDRKRQFALWKVGGLQCSGHYATLTRAVKAAYTFTD